VLVTRSNQHTKGTSEETSRRSLEEDEVSYILVCAAEAWWYSRM